jgi:hypothetical protein
MPLFFYIGNPKKGKEKEFFDKVHSMEPPKNATLYPFADRSTNKALHIVEAGSKEEVEGMIFKDLYETTEITEIMTMEEFVRRMEMGEIDH